MYGGAKTVAFSLLILAFAPGLFRHIGPIVTWLAYAGFYLTRKSFPVAKIGIQNDPSLGMSKLEMSWIDTAYLIAYAIGIAILQTKA